MTIDQWRQVKDIFEASLEREPSVRLQFIAEQSGGDDAIRQAAEQMLRNFNESGDFLEEPALVEFGLPGAHFDPGYEQGRRIGPYRIVGEIGQGGMGAVYLAERADDTYEKRVAIKVVLSGGLRSEINRRFNIERRVLAALEHPNIARLLDGGVTDDGWSYVVMEYVDGVPITTYCQQRSLPIVERLRLFQSVCEAVQYAHQNLIVHRDLKPSNILVTNAGDVKLLDFGIAKILDPTDDAVGQSPTLLNFLTPEYASPEHIGGQRTSTASDVYSLGVLIYELLTGARPFNPTSRSPQELIRLIETQEPTRPSQVSAPLNESTRKQLRGDLDNIILKALQKEPLRRYQSARQLSEDIARHLNGDPVIAREATLAYRLGKRIRRNKALTVGLTLLVLALIAGLLVTRSQLRASQTREREQRYELYAADMRQAGADWGEGNLVHMDELLERHHPGNGTDDEWRGFEWFALWKLLHAEELTIKHPIFFSGPCLTPDGKTVLVALNTGRIEMRDASTGNYKGLFAEVAEDSARLLLSPDGTKVAHLGGRGKIKLWDFATKRLLADIPQSGKLNERESRDKRALSFSTDGRRLAVRYNDAPLEEWDTETGRLIEQYPLPADLELLHDGPALYTPDGRLICLGRKEGRWHLWEARTNRVIAQLDPKSSDPNALLPYYPIGHLLSRDGTRYYLPTKDFIVRAWEIKTGRLVQVFRGHRDNIETPALSFDDKYLATGSDDRTLRIWDTQTGRCLAIIKNESQTFLPSFSADGHLAASCMRAFRVKIWDVPRLLAAPVSLEGITTLWLSNDSTAIFTVENDVPSWRQLATGHSLTSYQKVDFSTFFAAETPDTFFRITSVNFYQQRIERIARDTGKVLATAYLNHKGGIGSLCFPPNGSVFATSGLEDFRVKLWDPHTWREIAELKDHVGLINSCAFSPDSRTLTTSSTDSTVKVWDVGSQRQQATLQGHASWVGQNCFSPDGKTLASAGMDFTVKLWNVTTGHELRTLHGHANSVYCLAFSPDGSRLASGGDDQTIRLWDWQTGKELTALRGHTGKIWRLFFTSDGKTLISSGEDGTRIWRAATEEEVRALPANR